MKQLLLITIVMQSVIIHTCAQTIVSLDEQWVRQFELQNNLILLNDSIENSSFGLHQINYNREQGDLKRIFDGQLEQQFSLHSMGRRQIDTTFILQGEFGFTRQNWDNQQFLLDPAFDTYEYRPYYQGAKQAVDNSTDSYQFDGLAAYTFNRIGVALGAEYNISNTFGQTDPSADIQKTMYKPKLSIALDKTYQFDVSYQKEKVEGRYFTKNQNASLDDSNDLARFFYTGYGSRIIANVSRIDEENNQFSVGLQTKQDLAGGHFIAGIQSQFNRTEFFRIPTDNVRTRLVYGEYNTSTYHANMFYAKALSSSTSGFVNYNATYFTSNDVNRGINGTQSLELYEGNDYFHDLEIGLQQEKDNPVSGIFQLQYADISRVEVSKIAFVNKSILPSLALNKTWNNLPNDISIKSGASIGYQWNIENEMIITGNAGSNSPYFIQNIAIPETLFYRSEWIQSGIETQIRKQYDTFAIGLHVNATWQQAQNAQLYNEFETIAPLDGKRLFLETGITVTH